MFAGLSSLIFLFARKNINQRVDILVRSITIAQLSATPNYGHKTKMSFLALTALHRKLLDIDSREPFCPEALQVSRKIFDHVYFALI